MRAAIALGFLADGERLPREADLVSSLGVTVFAMREALGVLREEGLITTRPGNRGGSFVCLGTDRDLMTSGELRRLSATELRDLGDWRQMLTGSSAALAAARGSSSNVKRLREYAELLGSAKTELEARRAHGRFHIELAASAQSRRMTEAQITMYEEFDWLLGLALIDPAWRKQSAGELMQIAEAIEIHEPVVARAAAEAHASSTTAALNRLRLETIALEDAGMAPIVRATPKSVAKELEAVMSSVAEHVSSVAERAAEIATTTFNETRMRSSLSKVAIAGLLTSDLDIDGIGFAAAPDLIPDHRYWIGHWRRTNEGVVPDFAHVMDPARDDFYDYATMEVFVEAERTGSMYVQGPFVDYGGTNDYIVTVGVPAYANGEFIGIATADVEVAALERRLAPWLAGSRPCAIVNAEQLVILANMVEQTVGEVLRPIAGSRLVAVDKIGWSVLVPSDG